MNSFEGKRILVAGAAGFVPSHLCEFYLNQGAEVIGLDNLSTGSEENLNILDKFDNFQFFHTDIIDGIPKEISEVDFIFSLASPASPIDFERIPLEIMKVNALGCMHLLELAKTCQARFIEASTSEVYGDPKEHPQKETYYGHVNPIGKRACYDESKRFAEALTVNYHRQYGVDIRIVRIFNTYGPRMRADDGRVIPNFINQALKNESLTIYGDGKQTRSFCYISDLIEAIHCVVISSEYRPVNCGNPDEYTIEQTAKLICKFLECQEKFDYTKLPSDDPVRRRPDISFLQSFSQFKPKISFEQGIKKTVQYFRGL